MPKATIRRPSWLIQTATEGTDPLSNQATEAIRARAKIMDFRQKNDKFYDAITGRHPQQIDKALPSERIKTLYNALIRKAAAILVQLRANISGLNTYLQKNNIVNTDKCKSGITETVPNFLFACSRWNIPWVRQQILGPLICTRRILDVRKKWQKGRW
jgi:hypothetical protein